MTGSICWKALKYLYGTQGPDDVATASRGAGADVRAPLGVLVTTAFAFIVVIYNYAAIYVLISRWDTASFKVDDATDSLTALNALYFSIATSATVGYGDIVPSSVLARAMVSSQIVMSFLFVVLILSSAAALATRKQ